MNTLFESLALNQKKQPLDRLRLESTSKKTIAIGAVLLFSLVTGSLAFSATCAALQSINPAAAVAAVTIAAIGFLWFKKTNA